jgi:CRISPR-associated exonuclease Cas4
MLYLAIALALIAILLFWQAADQRRKAGLPAGRVIYADASQWQRVDRPLYDPILRLTGKPDYLIEQGGKLIPVEVKSTRVGDAPYDSHIFQLAAYCLLVARQMGQRPAQGLIHYPNQNFAIDYTPALETALLKLLDEMRARDTHKGLPRSHASPQRCARCSYRLVCDQRL